jgi:hypothetical protein
MNSSIFQAIPLGLIIGGVFAWLQMQALRRNELLEKRQAVPTLLKQLPGSGGRIAFLLMALVLVQVLAPHADKGWLSGSLAVGYGAPFLYRLLLLAPRKARQS